MAWGRKTLSPTIKSDYLDVTILLSFVLQIPRAYLLAHPQDAVSDEHQAQFCQLIARRSQGEPVPYLTGTCEFWSIPFRVTPHCLIPRPETELLVEKVLAYYPADAVIRVVDLGTGSGAIAIALSLERPHWQIIATDQSTAALQVAKHNAQYLKARIEFRQGSWFNALASQESFHAIISNPPYLRQNDPHLKGPIRYEPHIALIGGAKGTENLRYLIQHAPPYLTIEGQLWVEQGWNQADTIQSYFEQYRYKCIQQYTDLAGIVRVTSGRL
jgi:release factor glutamine methyltransferase